MTGITVTLLSKQQTGTDAFNRPTYSEISIPVENVLVAPVSEQEVLDTLSTSWLSLRVILISGRVSESNSSGRHGGSSVSR